MLIKLKSRYPAKLLDDNANRIGGDRGTRTPNLGIANAALSQLSYIPIHQYYRSIFTRMLTIVREKCQRELFMDMSAGGYK